MTTPTRKASEDVIELLHNHSAIPKIEPTTHIISHNATAYVISEPGEVTCVSVSYSDAQTQPLVDGVIQLTSTRPTITPADEVISHGRITRISHGPGRETRVYDT